MKTSDFFYNLPEELIAQKPVEPRDSSRLLVHHLDTGLNEHKVFTDILDYLDENDVLVINNTKVIPARIFGFTRNGGKVEFLLHKRIDLYEWKVLCKPARKAPKGSTIVFNEELQCEILEEGEMGERTVKFKFSGVFEDILSRIGETPLPPYIKEKLKDSSRYQTVYAKVSGSCAAPTAGLHFTDELLEKIKRKGIKIIEVLLHVGLGTFRPVQVEDVESHKMHSEYYYISNTSAIELNNAIKSKKRIICVGTTSVRTLESAVKSDGLFEECGGETNIFIYPPYKFKVVKGLITNFHLPCSTLIMLVSAFCGKEQTLSFYKEAVENRYRFFSFGDACLLI
ncbi:MAG: tRNA preQ1(34) S-adenosylmethionine ribosyltransferase-isomerase QueA [Clostridia bacterium]|nr:tRNA preQ1(34) S-adenosylmethionine ribosyltransferase-isomerase QueA [Clostridia bacterium]MBP5648511.1 tRNA preQ1(34) S-adenosylmethionine ribosyltransferase-isomerase QueA [Clostridia bacterium]